MANLCDQVQVLPFDTLITIWPQVTNLLHYNFHFSKLRLYYTNQNKNSFGISHIKHMLGTIPVKLFFKRGFTGSKCKLQMFLYRYPGSVDDYWSWNDTLSYYKRGRKLKICTCSTINQITNIRCVWKSYVFSIKQ